MKKIIAVLLAAVVGMSDVAAQTLTFDASKGVACSVTMPQGTVVDYTAYTDLYYVTDVEDSAYQYMNIFVPEGATQQTPIFMPNYVGGYMAAAARGIDAGDASGRALAEGYVVAIPGARGRNSTVESDGKTVYTGRAPKGLLDLKAAVRYLRHFDKEMAGDAEKIITDGTSAGGAMSSLLGSSGNNPAYSEYLKAMGAADERDDIFAAVCFCPIIDLDHADMAYEWLYGCTNNVTRPLSDEQLAVSEELAAQFAGYVDGLNLRKPDGTRLNAENYLDYIRRLLIESAQEAKNAGAEIADTLGFTFSSGMKFAAPVNGGRQSDMRQGKPGDMPPAQRPSPDDMPEDVKKMMKAMKNSRGEYITDLDMTTYLNYVVTTIALKTPPAFDRQGVAGGMATGENEEFGDDSGNSVNFTPYSIKKATGDETADIDAGTAELVRILNPMRMLEDEASTVATHWYIRHGARDRDTAFPIPINLATRLRNMGLDVDFKLPWNRPHSGDYALNELFEWIRGVTE